MSIGNRIKSERIARNWTQRDLAKKMGYKNHSIIARIEKGETDITQSRIVQFAEVFEISVADIMGWEKVQKNNDTITDIIAKIRNDPDFLSIVETIYNMDQTQIDKLNSLLSTLR